MMDDDQRAINNDVQRVKNTAERFAALIELCALGDPSTQSDTFEDEFELAYGALGDALADLSETAQRLHVKTKS